ncbi:hypothetical protein [Roseimicrobium sp. ORNL1]|uniref:hypothetical protein n=1 Tax=Roseimicrobium sp. ORNL1 TaxID=2711231 RepID=UPI0013E0EC9D|nr:hypothetical protein [Roseimicrobium sp. ORNL1]QIF03018.1 hypothetical protein G5S37_16310 [Roseimicrobium sp. ORNL1]
MPSSNVYPRAFATIGVVLTGVAVALGMWLFRGREVKPSSNRETVSAEVDPDTKAGATSVLGRQKIPSAAKLIFMGPGEDGYPELTPSQLEAYVVQEGRSAASLLTAFVLSNGEASWLREAAERYPENPRVSATMLMRGSELGGGSKEWIRRMQENDPKNSLGWYQAALTAFKNGNSDDALDALQSAVSRGRPSQYHEEFSREVSKAYRSAGYEALQAESLGASRMEGQHFSLLVELATLVSAEPAFARGPAGKEMLDLAEKLRTSTGRGMVMDRMAATMIDSHLLSQFELSDDVPGTGVFTIEQLEKGRYESSEIMALVERCKRLMPKLSDTEVKQFLRRMSIEGEVKAMEWVVQTHTAVK